MKNKNKLFKSFVNKTCKKCKESIKPVPGCSRKISYCGCFGGYFYDATKAAR